MPSNTSGLNRRRIRSQLIRAGFSVQSHTDGSISVFGATPEEVVVAMATLGYSDVRLVPQKLSNSTCFATPDTVEQGRLGEQGYRGTGTFALYGERADAFLAGGLELGEPAPEEVPTQEPEPEQEQEEVPEVLESELVIAGTAPEEGEDLLIDEPTPRRARRARRS